MNNYEVSIIHLYQKFVQLEGLIHDGAEMHKLFGDQTMSSLEALANSVTALYRFRTMKVEVWDHNKNKLEETLGLYVILSRDIQYVVDEKLELDATPALHVFLNRLRDDSQDFGALLSDIVRAVKEAFAAKQAQAASTESLGVLLPASITVDPGTAPLEHIAEYLEHVSDLYRMLGGSGLQFKPIKCPQPEGVGT